MSGLLPDHIMADSDEDSCHDLPVLEPMPTLSPKPDIHKNSKSKYERTSDSKSYRKPRTQGQDSFEVPQHDDTLLLDTSLLGQQQDLGLLTGEVSHHSSTATRIEAGHLIPEENNHKYLNNVEDPNLPDQMSDRFTNRHHPKRPNADLTRSGFEDFNQPNLTSSENSLVSRSKNMGVTNTSSSFSKVNDSATGIFKLPEQVKGKPSKVHCSKQNSNKMNSNVCNNNSNSTPRLSSEMSFQVSTHIRENTSSVNSLEHTKTDDDDVLENKRKRGRPPKHKPDRESLCARTVPYAWKNKTREQRLADFKLLLSSCPDNEPSPNSSSVPCGQNSANDQNKVSSMHQSEKESSNHNPSQLHNVHNHEVDRVPPLPDNRDYQRPHVSPDSGISAGGSPAPSHMVASPHHLAPVPIACSVEQHQGQNDGPPTLEPVHNSSSNNHQVNAQSFLNNADISPPPLSRRNSQDSDICSVYSSHSVVRENSHVSLMYPHNRNKTNVKKVVNNKLVKKRGRPKTKHLKQSGNNKNGYPCKKVDDNYGEYMQASTEEIPDLLPECREVTPRRKRGRPKGSSSKNKIKLDNPESNSEQNNETSSNDVVPPMPFPFPPYMMGLGPYPFLLPNIIGSNIDSSARMAEYLDNIFERFQADQTTVTSKSSESDFSNISKKNSQKEEVNKREINPKQKTSHKNFKLSKYNKTAISSKLNRALKISSQKVNKSGMLKKRPGRPRIHPLPVKRGRGRPRKNPIPEDNYLNQSSGFLKSSSASNPTNQNPSISSFIDKERVAQTTSTQNVPNAIKSYWNSSLTQGNFVSRQSLSRTDSLTDNEDPEYNIGPPVLFSEESQSPDLASPTAKPGDEFDKLMHSLHHIHAKISAKFHRRLSDVDQTEDTGTTDSESELMSGYYDGTMSDSQSMKKLVPNIRKAKLQVTPPKKKGRKKKTAGATSASQLQIECDSISGFSLPPAAYAFHKMPTLKSVHDSSSFNKLEGISEKCSGALMSNNTQPCSPASPDHSKMFPRSPIAQHVSPCSQAGSSVSGLSRESDLSFEARRKLNKRKKSKHFKSKHKNVVDPVFVAEVDNLAIDIENIQISSHSAPHVVMDASSRISVPVTFQIGKQIPKSMFKQYAEKQSSRKLNSNNQSVITLNKFKKARKRRHIQDGLDMARKKHYPLWLKRKGKLTYTKSDKRHHGGLPRRGPGRPRKVPLHDLHHSPLNNKEVVSEQKYHQDRNRKYVSETNSSDSDNDSLCNDEENLSLPKLQSHKMPVKKNSKKCDKESDFNVDNIIIDVASGQSPNVDSVAESVNGNADAQVGVKRGRGRPKKIRTEVKKGDSSINVNNQNKVPTKKQDTKMTISTGTDMLKQSVETSVQADFEIQCDLEPEIGDQPVKKGIDIGVQANPDEIRQLTYEAEEKVRTRSEIAIQVDNDDSNLVPLTEPLEIQVDFDDLASSIKSVDSARTDTKSKSPKRLGGRCKKPKKYERKSTMDIASPVPYDKLCKTDQCTEAIQKDPISAKSPSGSRNSKSNQKRGRPRIHHSPSNAVSTEAIPSPSQESPSKSNNKSETMNTVSISKTPNNLVSTDNAAEKSDKRDSEKSSERKRGRPPKKNRGHNRRRQNSGKSAERSSEREDSSSAYHIDDVNLLLDTDLTCNENDSHIKDTVTHITDNVEKETTQTECDDVRTPDDQLKSASNFDDEKSKNCEVLPDSPPVIDPSKKASKTGGDSLCRPPQSSLLNSSAIQFQAAFESFISGTGGTDIDNNVIREPSYHSDNETEFGQDFFPAPETVDLTEMPEFMEEDVNIEQDIENKSNCDKTDSVRKAKSKGNKYHKKKRGRHRSKSNSKQMPNRNSIENLDNDDVQVIEQDQADNLDQSSKELLNNCSSETENNTGQDTVFEMSKSLQDDITDAGTKKNKEVIVICESEDETDHRKHEKCPDCSKLQRGPKSKRNRKCSVHKSIASVRKSRIETLSPSGVSSSRSHSGADSDRECVVILERLDTSALPKKTTQQLCNLSDKDKKTTNKLKSSTLPADASDKSGRNETNQKVSETVNEDVEVSVTLLEKSLRDADKSDNQSGIVASMEISVSDNDEKQSVEKNSEKTDPSKTRSKSKGKKSSKRQSVNDRDKCISRERTRSNTSTNVLSNIEEEMLPNISGSNICSENDVSLKLTEKAVNNATNENDSMLSKKYIKKPKKSKQTKSTTQEIYIETSENDENKHLSSKSPLASPELLAGQCEEVDWSDFSKETCLLSALEDEQSKTSTETTKKLSSPDSNSKQKLKKSVAQKKKSEIIIDDDDIIIQESDSNIRADAEDNDESDDDQDGRSSNFDLYPAVCTLKRKNTNSEYEPLPVLIKKRKKVKNDMGYSQPKRRRKKKKSISGESAPSIIASRTPSLEIETIDLSVDDSSQEGSASQTESESVINSRPGTPARKTTEGIQLPRKRYQKAGLFSSSYKGNESCKKKKLDPKSLVYDPKEFEFGLMPAPIHVGKYMREKRIDFYLPYAIWFMHENNMLKSTKMLSPKYKKIRNNVYVDCRPLCKYENHPCNCRRPKENERGCGENCLNRMMFTECTPATCPIKDVCINQKFQKHEGAEGLEKFYTEDRGCGVRCVNEILTGEFVIEYVGEVITEGEFQNRMSQEYANDHHHYALNLDGGLIIDGYRMGNFSRFVNHSCDPNCEMQKWNVNGVYRMGLFAIKDILPGTELSYDYNFHSYNLDAQQDCKCGSANCRGVLGGKASQKLNGLLKTGRDSPRPASKDREKQRKTKQKKKEKDKEKPPPSPSKSQQVTPVKPLSHRERCFVQRHAIFLLRNLSKVRQVRGKSTPGTPSLERTNPFLARTDPPAEQDAFHTQLMALNTARTVKTRGLSVAQDNEEVAKVAALAQIFQIIFVSVKTYQDENGVLLATPLLQCPNRKKHPEYYQLIEEPIDLNTIEVKVTTGQYRTLEAFEGDFLRLFKNVEKYCGKTSEIGLAVSRLKKVFYTAKNECLPGLEEILGEGYATSAASECSSVETLEEKCTGDEEEEEVIRCVCNIYRDEGVMIQCEKCEKWQHADCMGEPDVEKYMCELCDPRPLSKEVLMKPPPDDAKPECTYYLTLLRDDLQVRVGDAVYILKDTSLDKPGNTKIEYSEYEKDTSKLDIFRVETLWKAENGDKFAFGHHYLRPHETFHEPNRKFFENEVFRIPLYEIVRLETIIKTCCVMDLPTYCRGRPKGIKESDVYICEYRIDKTARMFNKIGKPKYPINTKTYCFDHFPTKLYPKRTYSPHEVPENYKKKSRSESDQTSESGRSTVTCSDAGNESDEDIPLAQIKQIKVNRKKKRLHKFCSKLLSSIKLHGIVDFSHLLKQPDNKINFTYT